MKWKIGEPKEVIKKKKKTGRETRMRVWTGAWFFSFYVTSFLISTVTMLLASQWLMFQSMTEILRIGRDTKKDRSSGIIWREHAILILGQLCVLNKAVLN